MCLKRIRCAQECPGILFWCPGQFKPPPRRQGIQGARSSSIKLLPGNSYFGPRNVIKIRVKEHAWSSASIPGQDLALAPSQCLKLWPAACSLQRCLCRSLATRPSSIDTQISNIDTGNSREFGFKPISILGTGVSIFMSFPGLGFVTSIDTGLWNIDTGRFQQCFGSQDFKPISILGFWVSILRSYGRLPRFKIWNQYRYWLMVYRYWFVCRQFFVTLIVSTYGNFLLLGGTY